MPRTAKRSPRPAHRKPTPRAAAAPRLLITIDERHRPFAEKTAKALLERVAPGGYRLIKAPGAGFIGVELHDDDPRTCIARLHALFQEEPLAFEHTHRWIPIEAWSKPGTKEIRRLAQKAAAEIAPDESWGIRLERHGSRMERDALLHEIAAEISNPNVELEQPDKTVLVEALPNAVGLAVVGPQQVLSVDERMRKDFVRFEES